MSAMSDDYLEQWRERVETTRARFGIELPMVDWIAPQPRLFLGADEDELCKWIVDQYPELSPFELIIENSHQGIVTALFAGLTHGENRRFVEHRLEIELEDDLAFYTERVYFNFVRAAEKVRDEPDLDTRMPRWATR